MAIDGNNNNKLVEELPEKEEPVSVGSSNLVSPTAPKGTSFNRKTVTMLAAIGSIIVVIAFAFALSPNRNNSQDNKNPNDDQPVVTASGTPDTISQLPSSYGQNQGQNGVPQLGPPTMPVSPGQPTYNSPNPNAYDPSRQTYTVPRPRFVPEDEKQRVVYNQQNNAPGETDEQKLMREAKKSPIRFGSVRESNSNNGQTSNSPDNVMNTLNDLQKRLMGEMTGEDTAGTLASLSTGEEKDDQNKQNSKSKFFGSNHSNAFYSNNKQTPPLSPYEVKAGTVIPGVLITGINSDLPGQISGQVRENVYDTVKGKYLLIPQGTRIIGVYDSKIAFAQSRVMVIWTRLIFPNGWSLDIDNMPGTDLSGYSGLKDKVNNHYGKLFAGALLTSILAVGAKEATGNASESDMMAQGLSENVANIGTKVTEKNLDVQPTLEIRPGFKFNLFVQKDFILRPYESLK
jgi:type IV secretion system protein VirB10